MTDKLDAIPGVELEQTTPTVAESVYASSEYWPTKKLKLWGPNPRSIKGDRFEELKTRIKRQGQTKPLLITKDGTVIGGNMRLRAFKDLGWQEVWVSVTNATDDRDMQAEGQKDQRKAALKQAGEKVKDAFKP